MRSGHCCPDAPGWCVLPTLVSVQGVSSFRPSQIPLQQTLLRVSPGARFSRPPPLPLEATDPFSASVTLVPARAHTLLGGLPHIRDHTVQSSPLSTWDILRPPVDA